MPYVIRRNGQVTGLLRWQPVDLAEGEEFLPGDDPEVMAFRNRPLPTPAPTREDRLIEALKTKGIITDADLAIPDDPVRLP